MKLFIIACAIFTTLIGVTISNLTDSHILIATLPDMKITKSIRYGRTISSVAFYNGDKELICADVDGHVSLIDLSDPENQKDLTKHADGFAKVASSNSNILASGGYDGIVRTWDSVTLKQLWEYKDTANSYVYSLKFSKDSKMLAVGLGKDTTKYSNGPSIYRVMLIDTKSGKPVTCFDSGLGFDFSPDGATFAYSKSNGDIELIKIDGLKKIGQLNGYKDFMTSLSYSPDGKMIASTSNGVVNVWRISDRKRIKRLSAKVDVLGSVCFSRDSSMVIAGQLAVCIWRLSDGKLLYREIPSDKQYYGKVFRDVSSLAPAKNSDILAIGTMSRER